MEYKVKIVDIQEVAKQVKSFRTEKPEGYSFIPGQATDVAVNTPALKNELRPFTFTSLPEDPFLEFTIKQYPDHHGVTDAIHHLKPGDELVLHDVWGAIAYKGPGYFIAGGAGITPFLAILRWLQRANKLAGNTLFFSNKTVADIIYEKELKNMLAEQALFVLTSQLHTGYLYERIDRAFLKEHVKDINLHFYCCGPDPMVASITGILQEMGASADAVVFEK